MIVMPHTLHSFFDSSSMYLVANCFTHTSPALPHFCNLDGSSMMFVALDCVFSSPLCFCWCRLHLWTSKFFSGTAFNYLHRAYCGRSGLDHFSPGCNSYCIQFDHTYVCSRFCTRINVIIIIITFLSHFLIALLTARWWRKNLLTWEKGSYNSGRHRHYLSPFVLSSTPLLKLIPLP